MSEATGGTVVLIHGLSEERRVWERQAAHLRKSMNVVTYDVRGFGRTPVGAGTGTVRQMADDLAQIVCSHDLSPAWLVGFSMGGVIAQRFAIDFPELTAGLMLLASSCMIGRPGVEFFKMRIDEAEKGGVEHVNAVNFDDAAGCFSPGHDELVAEYRELRTGAVRTVGGYLNACRAMAQLSDDTLIDELGGIDRPTLIVAGELDPYCPPRASEMIRDGIPNSEMIVLDGGGHCFHWEQTDKTNALISDFVEANSAN